MKCVNPDVHDLRELKSWIIVTDILNTALEVFFVSNFIHVVQFFALNSLL